MSGKKIAQVLFAASAAVSMLIPSAAALATTGDEAVTPDHPMISTDRSLEETISQLDTPLMTFSDDSQSLSSDSQIQSIGPQMNEVTVSKPTRNGNILILDPAEGLVDWEYVVYFNGIELGYDEGLSEVDLTPGVSVCVTAVSGRFVWITNQAEVSNLCYDYEPQTSSSKAQWVKEYGDWYYWNPGNIVAIR